MAAVNGNIILLRGNTCQTSNPSEVAELDKPENYAAEPFDLTRYELETMLRKEEIVDMERSRP